VPESGAEIPGDARRRHEGQAKARPQAQLKAGLTSPALRISVLTLQALESDQKRIPSFTPSSRVKFSGSYARSCSCAVMPLTVYVTVSSLTGDELTRQCT